MEGQNKWMKKYIPANATQKEARVALLIPVKIDFKKKIDFKTTFFAQGTIFSIL